MTRIGCLHAHYSNIDYIQTAIGSSEVELVHFVDPGLMSRIASDPEFNRTKAQQKVIEQIEWIAQAGVDVILITCTNYIALLEEGQLSTTIPIIKIDEPFFADICNQSEPQAILFTNPATVAGTMKRLHEYADQHQKTMGELEIHVIENTFDLIMQGKKQRYIDEVSTYLKELLVADQQKRVSVAQLSMVEAAEQVERVMGVNIGNPLKTLKAYLDAMSSTRS
ncbi:hypothetical protein [Brevibacillus dissolubilis]|uniref:hypothetical protein n=1 Tax=Brevibacillus dissolubilis TaxID=1844116 RepID=UPI00111794C1|nr:hypothetical protein [Brevibacillus dissolubilis]